MKLVKEKGVHPYENIDSFERFSDKKLPDWWEFFSSLIEECINKKYFLNATNVWNVLKMNIMGDYHDL